MTRVFNFAAGPATLPEKVLKKAATELISYRDTGMSVMEMSHRSKTFLSIFQETEQRFRKLMNISDKYAVLFLQGGASSQFSMVPLNLMNKNKKADYVNTGAWSKKAIAEAKRYGDVQVVASSEDMKFNYIPKFSKDLVRKDADYVHITTNNTIYGTNFSEFPDAGSVPLVADMSSDILSKVYDVSKFSLIYAGAQKNIGPSGLTMVIIDKKLVGLEMEFTPTMMNYKVHMDNNSMYNTPPCYGIYLAKLMFEWVEEGGGLEKMEKRNRYKAQLLYSFLDSSVFFQSTVAKGHRSMMNIPFLSPSEILNSQFIQEAQDGGFTNLKGHRSVGGMRASIYNSMPVEGVEKLVDFMRMFEKKN